MFLSGYTITKSYLILIALLDFMGLGMVVTIFPHLMLDSQSCLLPVSWYLSERLSALGVFLAIYPLGQFFGAMVLGKLSDCHGRKKILLISLLGTAVGFILSGVAVNINSAGLLFFSRLVSGIFAGNVAIAQASMADISTEKTKSHNLTLIQTALGLAWVIGPALGGWLSLLPFHFITANSIPFGVMSIIFFILALYTLFFYTETLQTLQSVKINLFSGFQQISLAYSYAAYRYAFIIWFIFVAGWWLFEAFLPAYLLEKFHFTTGQIGNFLASMGATYALFQYFIVRPLSKKMLAENMVKYPLIIAALSVASIIFINHIIALHIAITLFVMAMGFVLPGLMTSLSNLASKENQGHMMGMISSVQAIATVLMMMIGGYLDKTNITVTVICGSLLLLISWILFLLNFKEKYN